MCYPKAMENRPTGKKKKLVILLFLMGIIIAVGAYLRYFKPTPPVAMAGYGNVLFGMELEYPKNLHLGSSTAELTAAASVGVVRDIFEDKATGEILAIGARKSGETSTGEIADAVPEINTKEAFDARIQKAKKYVTPNDVEVYIFGSRKSGIWGGTTVREADLVSPNSLYPYVTISAKGISKQTFMQIVDSITTDK